MTAETKARAACLIGWPAAHSRSPLIHHYWLRTLGIDGGYNIEAVPPEEVAEFIQHLSKHGFVGANVTIPHKERALQLTEPDARAKAVGAANTLYYDGETLRSTNTDVEGFVGNLDASAPGWDRAGEALVLGAGGSSRAVVFGLIERGVTRIHLANRTIERAQALADQFGAKVAPIAWNRIGDVLPRAGLLVNTTSLGMAGKDPLEIDLSLLPRDAVRPLILVLLVAMFAYTLLKPDFGSLHRPRHIGHRELAIALAMGAAIGFYDGFFGPGTGSFLIFLFIRFFGLDFLRASAASKVVNLATNLAALAFFVPSGKILFAAAVPMAAANVAGALTGTRLALRGGTPLIRRLFLVLVVVLIARMGWDILRA